MKNSAGRQLFLWAYMLTVTDDHFKACDSAGVIRILIANCRANTLALQQEKKIQFQDAMDIIRQYVPDWSQSRGR